MIHLYRLPEVRRRMWLLLVHQVPREPAYQRVKVRRRLRRIGAAALKSTVYVLPATEAARESFEWLAREIRAEGGDAVLCEARLLSGTTDDEVRDLFRAEREAEYREIVREVEEVGSEGAGENHAAKLARARRRLEGVARLDFFDAPGRARVERAIGEAEARLADTTEPGSEAGTPPLDALRGKVWVTRRGVHVDRMASAWLIRRFIDPAASFRFVDPDGYRQAPGEVRYDMFEAEFTHDGDRCTFEVLSSLVAPGDATLRTVGEIVHDIDLRDGKFGRSEAAGIERVIAGIQASHAKDEDRLARAAELFDGLYRVFGGAD